MTNCTNFLKRPHHRVVLNLLYWILAIIFIPMAVFAQPYSSSESSLKNDSDLIDDIVVKRILVLAKEGVIRIACKQNKDCQAMGGHACIKGICRPSVETCEARENSCKAQGTIFLAQTDKIDCECVECTTPEHCKNYNTKATRCIKNKCQTPPEDCKSPPNISITLTDKTTHCVWACTDAEKRKCNGSACANGNCLNPGQCFNDNDCTGNDKSCFRKPGSGQLVGTCAGCSKNEHCEGPGPNGSRNPKYKYWCDMSKGTGCSSKCGSSGECNKAGGVCVNRNWCYNKSPEPTPYPTQGKY